MLTLPSTLTSLVLDYITHLSIVSLTLFIIDSRSGLLAISLSLLLNVIYIGQYCDKSHRRQYGILVDFLSQFFQGISSPRFAVLMAAINSYFSLTRFKILVGSFLLHRYRQEVACWVRHFTRGVSWGYVTYLESGRRVMEVQLTFALVAGILKGMEAWQTYEATHPETMEVHEHRDDLS